MFKTEDMVEGAALLILIHVDKRYAETAVVATKMLVNP
jgi:hypothetical protein